MVNGHKSEMIPYTPRRGYMYIPVTNVTTIQESHTQKLGFVFQVINITVK